MMWELYERLIEPIPDDVPVDEIIVGTSCTMVRAGGAAGGGRQPGGCALYNSAGRTGGNMVERWRWDCHKNKKEN